MSIVITRVIDQRELAAAVERAARALAPDVVRIQYRFGEDWTGKKSIYFGVVLSDKAARQPIKRLGQISQHVQAIVENEINVEELEELGLNTYFTFRGESEQAKMKDRWP